MAKKRYRTPSAAACPTTAAAGDDAAGSAAGRAAAMVGRPSAAPSSPAFAPGEEAVVRRTRDGWRVGDDELPDLMCAMVLADLLAAELPTEIQPAVPAEPGTPQPASGPAARPGRRESARRPAPDGESGAGAADEAHRLRTTVGQLEHALTARVRIEQAIGVLAERHRIRPRQAFEQLRSAARNRGRRVIDIATDVVASASNPLLQLPEELSRQRSSPRHARNARRALRPE
jgi:ANTAR domain